MTYLTEETFTFIINTADRDLNYASSGVLDEFQNILLSKDFGVNMGGHLDSSVEKYYCEVIQYTYNNYNDGGVNTEFETNVNFTQLFSDIVDTGKTTQLLTDRAKYPLTNLTSTKNNTHLNNSFNGVSRNSTNQRQKNTFTCNNFNQMVKHFRLASLRYGERYGFIDINSSSSVESYGDPAIAQFYSVALAVDGAADEPNLLEKINYLKNYPIVIMYMTPIYKDRIPKLLNNNQAITLMVSSLERVYGENGYGVDVLIDIKKINSPFKRFKAEFKSLEILGSLGVSRFLYNATMPNNNFNFTCYNWDKSNYKYGGIQNDANATILTSFPVIFNHQSTNKVAKLASYNGSIIEIENIDQQIRFNFLCSQNQSPNTSISAGGFIRTTFEVIWEWQLTLRLYGIG